MDDLLEIPHGPFAPPTDPRFDHWTLPGWRGWWAKPDRRPIYTWGHEHVVLPEGAYAIPGRFDVGRSRYLIEPFDAVQDECVREVTNCGAVQTGKSLIADISIPWLICNAPGSLMWTHQSEDDGKEHMLTRCIPLWYTIKPLVDLMPTSRHLRTMTEFYFDNCFLLVNGANILSLQSKSIRYKFNSELWTPPWQAKGVYEQAARRVSAYARQGVSKIINDSQAGMKDDVVDKAVNRGHYARWSYTCVACNKTYPLRITQKTSEGAKFGMVWADDALRTDGTWNVSRCVETVRWRCACGFEMPDSEVTRAAWNERGHYVASNPGAPRHIRSFWWSAVHVQPMAELAAEKADALNTAKSGNMEPLKSFRQQRENEPWEEQHLTVTIATGGDGYCTDPVNAEKPGFLWPLNQMDERPFALQLPELIKARMSGEKFRTLMADRQQGMGGDTPHRWCEIRAWFPGGDSRQIYFGRVNTKEGMRDLQLRYGVEDRQVWQDINFEKHLVFEECATYGWMGCGGSTTGQNSWVHHLPDPKEPHNRDKHIEVRWPFSPWQKTIVLGKVVHYLTFAPDYMKDILANLIAGRGVKHEVPVDVLPSYLTDLQGEHKTHKNGKMTWVKVHSTKKNHGFDTSVQGIVFALLMKLIAMPKPVEEKTPPATS